MSAILSSSFRWLGRILTAMGFWKSLRFWITDSVKSRGRSVKQSTSLEKTLRDAMHIRGGNQQSGSFSSSEKAAKHAYDGHEEYQRSFEKKD